MPKEWQFVATTNDGKVKDEGSQKLVRRSVMRDFRRNERLGRINQLRTERSTEQENSWHQGSDEADCSPACQPTSTVVAQEEADLSSQWKATLVDIGPAAVFDPFVSTTLYSNKSYIKLFIRFVYQVAVQIQPLGQDVIKNPFSVVFARNALADPLVLSALLYHASVHQDSLSPETLQHEAETARQLASRLVHPDEASSDSVIAAVGLMAATGNITGNVNREHFHWEALQKLVKQRGGLQALGWDGALAMIISVDDIISATITFSKPKLHCPQVPSSLIRAPLHIIPDISPYTPEQGPQVQIAEITMLIKSISEIATQILRPDNDLRDSTASIISHTQVISAIEHRLLSIESSNDVPQLDLPVLHIIRSAKAAALISTTYYFRIMTSTSATIRSLRRQVGAALEALDDVLNYTFEIDSLKLLLWSCWIGALAAEDQEWFVGRIICYMTWMNLYCWEDLESCLQGFILAPKRYHSAGASLWQRVMDQSSQLSTS